MEGSLQVSLESGQKKTKSFDRLTLWSGLFLFEPGAYRLKVIGDLMAGKYYC
jgi:hypothetical protein